MPCNEIISDNAIKSIYKYKGTVSSVTVTSYCVSSNEKKVDIDIFSSVEPSNRLNHQPIQRTYYNQKNLFKNPSLIDKVVVHDYFILKGEYRGQHIMTKLHTKELQTYKLLNFKEIQLNAAWDGLIVWKKMNYQFLNTIEESKAIIALQRYLREERQLSVNEINDIIKNNPFSINLQYLRAENNVRSFMDWAYNNRVGCSKMYKEVVS